MFFLLGLLLLLATFSTKITSRIGIPGLVVFLGLGMFFGSDVLNLIYFDNPILAQQIAVAALVIILFDGGFTTNKSAIKTALVPASILATAGVIITAGLLGLLSYLFLDIDLKTALLIGAITSSTDAAAVFSLLRAKLLSPKSATTLEMESASNDPMAIILTVTLIELIQGQLANPAVFVLNLTWQIFFGGLIGFAIGKIGPVLFNKVKLEASGFYYVLILGLAFTTFGTAEVTHANGFIAVFIAGLVMGQTEFAFKQGVARNLEGVATFVHVILFLILGLLVFPSQVLSYWQHGVIISLLLMLVARPIAIFLCTIFWPFSTKEKIFLSWGGIKGAVPIVLATYPLVAGLPTGGYIFNTVFFVVVISTLIQGSSLYWVANKVGILVGEKKKKSYHLELIATEITDYALLEYEVEEDSHLIGQRLGGVTFPPDSLVTAIVRNNKIIAPRGATLVCAHDTLFILVKHEDKEEMLETLEEEKSALA